MQLLLGLTALVQVWSVQTGQRIESKPINPPHQKVWFESDQVQIGKTPPRHPAVDHLLARQGDRWLVGAPDGAWLSRPAPGIARLPLPDSPLAVAWVPDGVVALTTGPSALHYFPRGDATTGTRLPLPPSMDCNRTRLHVREKTVTFVCNERIVQVDLGTRRIEDLKVPARYIAFDTTGRRARIHERTLFIEQGARRIRRIRLPADRTWTDLALDSTRVIAGTARGEAFEFSATTGKRLWHSKIGQEAVSAARVAGQSWYVLDDSRPPPNQSAERRVLHEGIKRDGWSHANGGWVRLHGGRAICRSQGEDDCAQRLMVDTYLNAVALSPTGQVAFIGNFKGIGLWNPRATSAPMAQRALVGTRVYDAEAWVGAMDGSTVVVSSAHHSGVVTPGSIQPGPAIGRWPVAVAGQTVWWSTNKQAGTRRLRFWDLQTQSPLRIDPIHRDQVTAVVASPDRRWVATGDESGLVVIWHTATRQMQHVFRVGETIEQLVFNAQSTRLAVRAVVDGYTDRPQPFWPPPVLTPQPPKTPGVRQWRVNQPIGAVALTPKGLVAGVGEYLMRIAPDGQIATLHAFDSPIKVITPDGDGLLIALSADRGIVRLDAGGTLKRMPMRGRLHLPERLWTDGTRTVLMGRQLGASDPSIAVWHADRPAVLTPTHPQGAPGEAMVLLDMAPKGRKAQLLMTGDGEQTGWLQTWDLEQAKVIDTPRPLGKLDLYSLRRGGDGALWVGGYAAIHRVLGRRQSKALRAEGQFPLLAPTADGVAEAHSDTVRWWRHVRGKIAQARPAIAFAGGDITALDAHDDQVAVAQRGTESYHGPTIRTLSWYTPPP